MRFICCNTGERHRAGLFLAQCERVDGCRCVAKESSEISADPGQSLPLYASLSLSRCFVVLSEALWRLPVRGWLAEVCHGLI